MKRLAGLIICLFSMKSAISQNYLGMSQTNQGSFITPHYFNQTDSLHLYVVNYGNSNFTGNLSIICAYVDSSNGANTLVPFDSTYFQQAVIPANDSAAFDIDIIYSPNNFRRGNNVVVIWPVTSNSAYSIRDTLNYAVNVDGYLNLKDIKENRILVFPNPATEEIIITQAIVKQVRIFDLSGNLVYNGNNNRIPLTGFSKGAYVMEIVDNEGKVSRQKFIKQ